MDAYVAIALSAHRLVAIVVCFVAPSVIGAPPAGQQLEIADAMLSVAQEIEVSAATSGLLQQLLVREGSMAAQGKVLLEVDDRRAAIIANQALVDLKQAAARAKDDVKHRHAIKSKELADSEHQRAIAIDNASPSSVSDRELNRLRLAAEVAGLEVERAEQDQRMATYEWRHKQEAYRLAQQELKDHHVAAPVTGLVVKVHKQPGEWVNRGDPVLTLVGIDRLRAEGFLPVGQASLDLVGAPAQFTTTMEDGRTLLAQGRVAFVSPRADPVTALATVWIDLQVKDRRLRPGLRGALRITALANEQPPLVSHAEISNVSAE